MSSLAGTEGCERPTPGARHVDGIPQGHYNRPASEHTRENEPRRLALRLPVRGSGRSGPIVRGPAYRSVPAPDRPASAPPGRPARSRPSDLDPWFAIPPSRPATPPDPIPTARPSRRVRPRPGPVRRGDGLRLVGDVPPRLDGLRIPGLIPAPASPVPRRAATAARAVRPARPGDLTGHPDRPSPAIPRPGVGETREQEPLSATRFAQYFIYSIFLIYAILSTRCNPSIPCISPDLTGRFRCGSSGRAIARVILPRKARFSSRSGFPA